MTGMKVTVAIPCYNGALYVGQAIEAILGQSQSADEVLVIDDGSTDNSVQIIERYPVRLLQHKGNKGIAAARNTALAAASGDVLVFVDVDAFADSRLLEVLLTGYNEPEIGGVGGQGIESNIQSNADRWRKMHASQNYGEQPKDVGFLYGLCMSFRLSALQEVGGFNPIFRTNAEDVDIGLRLNAAGYRLRYLPQAKVYHQKTDDRASLRHAMQAWYAWGYCAKLVNCAQPWTSFTGAMIRLVQDPLEDIFVFHNAIPLAPLSLSIGLVRLWALLKMAWTFKGRRC
jgi:glycosyltransferase involved in cell wall biosynthesis